MRRLLRPADRELLLSALRRERDFLERGTFGAQPLSYTRIVALMTSIELSDHVMLYSLGEVPP